MKMRAFFLILLGALEAAWCPAVADKAVAAAVIEIDRSAGFEVIEEAEEPLIESPVIFAPLSPIAVEAEPVRLPEDPPEDQPEE